MTRKENHRRTVPRALIALFAVGLLLLAGCGTDGGTESLQLSAVVNGVDADASSASDPIRLTDRELATINLTVSNTSDQPQTVRYLRFEGQAVDMVFLAYDTAVNIPLEAGETQEVPTVRFDFFDLGSQAQGYLRGTVQVFDGDRQMIGSTPIFLDASGTGFSTLTWFNLLLLVSTASGLLWNLVRLAQRRLPPNRFMRALRFLVIGAGAGLTLAVAFSTLRLWPLDTLAWILFMVAGGVIGYGVGFLLPGSDDQLIDILDEQDVLDAVADEEIDSDQPRPRRVATVDID